MSNFDVTVSPLLFYMELFYSLYIIYSLYRQLNYAILHIQEFSLLSVLYNSSHPCLPLKVLYVAGCQIDDTNQNDST